MCRLDLKFQYIYNTTLPKRKAPADRVSTSNDVEIEINTGNRSPSKEDLLEKIDHQNKKKKLLQQKV